MGKLISFIITYHNEPLELLEECLQSVRSLSLRDDEREILLIDDGSSVPAPESEGVVLVRQENQGLSAARNHGLEMASGEYIQFVDADDYLIPEVYDEGLELQRKHNPDMVMFGFTRGKARRGRRSEMFDNGVDFMNKRNIRAAACSYMFRREALGDLRFFPGILHEDELFTPQLLLRVGKLVVMDSTPYFYRLRLSTITHSKEQAHVSRRLDDTLFVIRQLDALAAGLQGRDKSGMDRRVVQLAMAYVYVVWRDTHSRGERLSRLSRLRDAGLYPLPVRCYTWKYWLFSLLTHIC